MLTFTRLFPGGCSALDRLAAPAASTAGLRVLAADDRAAVLPATILDDAAGQLPVTVLFHDSVLDLIL